jgi:hypothetical protein
VISRFVNPPFHPSRHFNPPVLQHGLTTAQSTALNSLGAQAVINKDLYYQRTIPALLTQMEANRSKAKLAITKGLGQPDAEYSLMQAYLDLDIYKNAGSMANAISSVTQAAGDAKDAADQEIVIQRQPNYIATGPARDSIEAKITALSGAQALKLANAMISNLSHASPEAQEVAKRYGPTGSTFTEAQQARARQFVVFWVEFETMTPERTAQWNAAIATATNP